MFYDRRASGVFGSHWTSGRAPRATTSPASLLQSALPLLDAAAEMKKEGNSYSPKIHRSWQIFGGFCGLYHWFSRLALIFIHPVMKAMAQVGFEGSALLTQAEARLRLQSKWASSFTVAFSQGKWRDMNEKDRLLLFFSFSVCCLDALLGFFLMLLLHLHWDHLLLYLTSLRHWAYSQQLAAHLVPWLMGAPADFKLNHELTSFAGSLFLSMFSLWDVQLPPDLLEALAVSARIFACFCAMMGGSMAVALVMDVLAITSLPLFVAYVGTCLCWRMATRSLYSLCLLFQGWKYNILRSRVDHHNFSLDQLLIGVILLSIVVFPSAIFVYVLHLLHCCLVAGADHSRPPRPAGGALQLPTHLLAVSVLPGALAPWSILGDDQIDTGGGGASGAPGAPGALGAPSLSSPQLATGQGAGYLPTTGDCMAKLSAELDAKELLKALSLRTGLAHSKSNCRRNDFTKGQEPGELSWLPQVGTLQARANMLGPART